MHRPASAAPLHELLVEDGQAVLAHLPHRLDQRDPAPPAHRPAQPDATLVLLPARQLRHEVDAERPPARQYAGDRLERLREILVREQGLQHAVRGHHQPAAPAAAKRQRPDVAAHDRGLADQAGPSKTRPKRADHGRGAIYADEAGRHPRHRHRQAPGSASQLQYRTVRTAGQIRPEPDVAAADRAPVLPVVERGVGVPALPAGGAAVRGHVLPGVTRAPARGHRERRRAGRRSVLPAGCRGPDAGRGIHGLAGVGGGGCRRRRRRR